jgi:hypothetical protein
MRRALALAVIAISTIAGASLAQDRGYDRDRDRDRDPGREARGGQPPPGDYFRTCRNVSTYGYGREATLTAECRDDRGRWRQTSLRYGGCDRVENRDGDLVCRGGGGDGGRPPFGGGGGFRPGFGSQVTIFTAPNFGGERFQARGEITNLPRRYNDQALSLRIEGRGAWQVCSDSDFRGRCQIFDRDVADLRPYGLGFAVSSMRPAR